MELENIQGAIDTEGKETGADPDPNRQAKEELSTLVRQARHRRLPTHG